MATILSERPRTDERLSARHHGRTVDGAQAAVAVAQRPSDRGRRVRLHLYIRHTSIDHILYTRRVTVNTKSYWEIERNMLLVFCYFNRGFFSFCNFGDCDFHDNLKVNNITNYSLSVSRNNVEVCALSHRYYIIPLTK